jgi:hypothetical protein
MLCFTQEWIKDRASCDCGCEEGGSGGDAGLLVRPCDPASFLLPSIVIFNFFPQNACAELNARIHCQIHSQIFALSSFQCEAATSSSSAGGKRREWGAWVADAVGEQVCPSRSALASSIRLSHRDFFCHAPTVVTRLTPRRLALETLPA